MSRLASFPFLFLTLTACAIESRSEPADRDAFLALGIRGAAAPMDDVYCSGQPTEEQFAKLADAGVDKFISLRVPTEEGTGWEEEAARRIGIDFVRIPVDGAAGVTVENARALAREMESSRGPVLVACGTSNRVGALLAMKARHVDGKSADEALRIGAQCGMKSLAPDVQRKVRSQD